VPQPHAHNRGTRADAAPATLGRACDPFHKRFRQESWHLVKVFVHATFRQRLSAARTGTAGLTVDRTESTPAIFPVQALRERAPALRGSSGILSSENLTVAGFRAPAELRRGGLRSGGSNVLRFRIGEVSRLANFLRARRQSPISRIANSRLELIWRLCRRFQDANPGFLEEVFGHAGIPVRKRR